MSGTGTRISPRPPLLSLTRQIAVYVIAGGVWLTGALWVLLHYFFMGEGPFGPVPHPLEFWSLAGHGAFAFGSLWLFGLLWGVHIPPGWRLVRRRWTGGIMFAFFAWYTVSGYLLYYLGGEEWRETTILLHWTSGLAAPIPFLIHRFQKEPKRKGPS